MTDLERIKERWDKGGVIFLTSFLNLFMLKLAALAGPGIIFGLMYYEWNGFDTMGIFLSVGLLLSIVWSLYLVLATGSVFLKGDSIFVKRHFRRARKLKVDEVQDITSGFVKKTLSSSGTRFTRIHYIGSKGKPTSILIMEGQSFLVEPKPKAEEILGMAGWYARY